MLGRKGLLVCLEFQRQGNLLAFGRWAIQESYEDPSQQRCEGPHEMSPFPAGVIALGGKGPVEHAGPIWEIGFSPI